LEYLGLNDSNQSPASRLATFVAAYKHYVTIYSNARPPDVAIFDESLARDIAEIVFGYGDLVSLHLETSFPAVDLGSQAAACAIQVTLSGSTTTIVETQEKFFAHGLDGIYSRLTFIILGEKQATYDSERIVRSRGAFAFDPDRDIYDLDDLFNILVSSADPAKIEAFADRLQRELGSSARPYGGDP
jgi:hypothetical protein